jgi:hypothetical protein
MSTLKQRLAALNVEVGERPSPMRKIRAENLEDLTQRQRVLIADDLGLYVDYIFSLELALASLAGEVERLRAENAAKLPLVELEAERCFRCDGYGWCENNHDGLSDSMRYRCPRCNGTGRRR